ncbi:hypothetical protein VE03_02572 [Pseudogymnoascus sp. 23342-1-I1]|nr:hypothetical protein VE03_02572 [Pseudogymnoascus sp. 23342-1-I1]
MSQDNGNLSFEEYPSSEGTVPFDSALLFNKALLFENDLPFENALPFEDAFLSEEALLPEEALFDEFKMAYDPEMPMGPPHQDTTEAAGRKLDSRNKPIFPHKGIITGLQSRYIRSSGTNFDLPFREAFKDTPSLEAPESLSPPVAPSIEVRASWPLKSASSGSSGALSTVSKYAFQGQTINGHDHIVAADFRAQIKDAPKPSKHTKYRFGFSDIERVAPELPRPLLHVPIVPGQKKGFKGKDKDAGVLRGIYSRDRVNKGAVLAFHDPKKGRTASGNRLMTRCGYHPARHRRKKVDGGVSGVVKRAG